MKQYKKPEFHFARIPGGLSGDEIAKLSDDRFRECLEKNSYVNEKKKYRIKPGFVLREIAGEYTIIPVDAESRIFNAIMVPNDSAVFLWKIFEQSSTIEDAVINGVQSYNATEDIIRNSIEHFVKESLKYQVLEEVE